MNTSPTDVLTLAARDWFAAYLVNILAIAGPVGTAFIFFHLWQGDLRVTFAPFALICLPWLFLALLKTRVPLAAKTAAFTIFFLIAALLIATEQGLLLQAALMTIFAGLTLIVFYGNRGFYLAILSCFGLLSWSAQSAIFRFCGQHHHPLLGNPWPNASARRDLIRAAFRSERTQHHVSAAV